LGQIEKVEALELLFWKQEKFHQVNEANLGCLKTAVRNFNSLKTPFTKILKENKMIIY
jgi:hypothetical protein